MRRNTSASQALAHCKESLEAIALAKLVGVGCVGDILSMVAMVCPARFALVLRCFSMADASSLGPLKSGNVKYDDLLFLHLVCCLIVILTDFCFSVAENKLWLLLHRFQ